MKLFAIDKNVISGQCKGALLRMQFRYTAIFFCVGLIPGWVGSQVGFFTPTKTKDGYICTEFYFKPWLAKDIAVCKLPKWYRAVTRAISFRFNFGGE